ncbi:UNVERIFIED_CONTAM: hypothetical protein RMT77_004102 [Armadillidium vulgare]
MVSMMRQMNFSPFLCGLIFVLFWGSVTPRPKSGLSLAMLRQSEEVGRLRRGFQTSSLATARGFGKRSRTGEGPYEVIPFLSDPERDFTLQGKQMRTFDPALNPYSSRGESYPIGVVVEMLKMDQNLAKSFVSRFLDTDGDGLISIDEILHEQ